jgi:hypothetical protein
MSLGANTEGGRIHRETKSCYLYNPPALETCGDCVIRDSVQSPITPTEGSRILSLQYNCDPTYASGFGTPSFGVTQARVKKLLSSGISKYSSEGVRIDALQQQTILCNPGTRNPIVLPQCPRLPPPPVPPARTKCPLTKNQKMS